MQVDYRNHYQVDYILINTKIQKYDQIHQQAGSLTRTVGLHAEYRAVMASGENRHTASVDDRNNLCNYCLASRRLCGTSCIGCQGLRK